MKQKENLCHVPDLGSTGAFVTYFDISCSLCAHLPKAPFHVDEHERREKIPFLTVNKVQIFNI